MGPVKRAEIEPRAVVSWEGPGEPIMLTVYGIDGEAVALPLLPKRALVLAQELLTRGVQAIKADPEAPWHPDAQRPSTSPQDRPATIRGTHDSQAKRKRSYFLRSFISRSTDASPICARG